MCLALNNAHLKRGGADARMLSRAARILKLKMNDGMKETVVDHVSVYINFRYLYLLHNKTKNRKKNERFHKWLTSCLPGTG